MNKEFSQVLEEIKEYLKGTGINKSIQSLIDESEEDFNYLLKCSSHTNDFLGDNYFFDTLINFVFTLDKILIELPNPGDRLKQNREELLDFVGEFHRYLRN